MVHRGLTILELLIAMVAIAVTSVIMLPGLYSRESGNRRMARTASCMSNMKQIGLAAAQYAEDYDETYPYSGGGHDWPDESAVHVTRLLMPYLKVPAIFLCPFDPFREHGSVYEALSAADRQPSVPTYPTSYYYFYDFYHADIGTNRVPPCTGGPIRAAAVSEVLAPEAKAMFVCTLSDQYVSLPFHYAESPADMLVFADRHVKYALISSLADTNCGSPHDLDWTGVGSRDLK